MKCPTNATDDAHLRREQEHHGKVVNSASSPIAGAQRENLHRTQDVFSPIVIIGYSMPPYDSYAFETFGRMLIDYQQNGSKTSWGTAACLFNW